MKTVVSILGATASGKSSLSRALLGNEAKEYYATIGSERIRVTFGADGFALAGGIKNGSDSIGKMLTLRATVELLLAHSEVVLTDGFRCTHVFAQFLQELPIPDLSAVFVYLETSLEENAQRLMARRRAAGVIEEALPASTKINLLRARKRAWAVFDRARLTYKRRPASFVTLAEELTPHQSAVRVRAAINDLRRYDVNAA